MEDDIEAQARSAGKSHAPRGYQVYKTGYAGNSNLSKRQLQATPRNRVEKYGGYVVQLGSGSAYGGQWKPRKPEDERFYGTPGELYESRDRNGNLMHTKMDDNRKATKERHYTDHGYPKYHSNPHDHILRYRPDGSPDWENSKQINYFAGDVPEIKHFKEVGDMPDNRKYTYENLKKRDVLSRSILRITN